MRKRAFLIVGFALIAATGARAQDAQTYLYDANGRVIAATTARTGANGAMVSYLPDDADNRVARTSTIVSPPLGDKLVSPYVILPSQRLTSANGQYTMTLEASGDLVIAGSSGMVWNSCTGQGRSMYVRITSDGRMVIYSPEYTSLWTTSNAASAGAELTLQNSGVAVLKSTGGTTLWSSITQCQ